MAAFETPWLHSISQDTNPAQMDTTEKKPGEQTPTSAAFSPVRVGSGGDRTKTLLVHQKSPLLITTPPQVTRALAFSHPYLLPLSHLMGLLSWTTGDPWESYLLVASFWALVVYGDSLLTWTGPVFMVGILILAMYSRRYSPLSTRSTSDPSTKVETESIKHQKSLDDIVDELNVFTSRCNILAEPWLQLTEFLSTQITPTTTTTKPALVNLLLRILMVTPIWIVLACQPIAIITSQRVVFIIGTITLTWHSRPARVCRNLLWRSTTIHHICSLLTGLNFMESESPPALPPRRSTQHENALSIASKSRGSLGGVRFTFVVYENQRRWLGLGWTSQMLAYERASWTDEHLNPSLPKEKFPLPKVEGGHAAWKWVPGDDWKTESARGSGSSDRGRNDGWIYYDNKWNNGRKSDGWSQYTRRRKWYRDAELVEITNETPAELSGEGSASTASSTKPPTTTSQAATTKTEQSETPTNPRKGMFRKSSKTSTKSSLAKSVISDADVTTMSPTADQEGVRSRFGFSEDMEMSLG